MDWTTVVSILALALSATIGVMRLSSANISLREHEEFKTSVNLRMDEMQARQNDRLVIREFRDWAKMIRHEFRRIDGAIQVLDTNKPTTGELNRESESLKARLVIIEEQLRGIRINQMANGRS